MSRLKRLKEKRKKQFIRIAMSSLVLTLTLGLIQTMPTYAWFNDSEDVYNDLVISMGDIGVDISKGFDKKDLSRGDKFGHEFNIENKGSLKEHLRLKFGSINSDITKFINCNFIFEDYNGKSISNINMKLNNLISNEYIELKYKSGELVVLKPRDSIKCKVVVAIDKETPTDLINVFVNTVMEINLKVLASQVNEENVLQDVGFRAMDTQLNTLQFRKITEPDIPQEGNVDVKFDSKKHIKIIIKDIPILNNPNIDGTPEIMEDSTGEFSKELIDIKTDNENRLVVEKKDGSKFDINNTEFNEENTLILKFKMTDGTYKILKFKFMMDNHEDKKTLMAYYNVIKQGDLEKPSEPEVVEPPKEEVEKPSEPEVSEPPKEEVEKPSESEVVEPPKEEVEVPSEPEVSEPPKEEVEVPSEPEVVEPPKEEMVIPTQPDIATSKEEIEI